MEKQATLHLIDEARNGNGTAMLELWLQYRRFIYQQAIRRKRAAELNGTGYTIDVDDLVQGAWFGFVEAVNKFDPERAEHGSFITLLSLYLKQSFNETLGLRTMRQANDPIQRALSIDVPLPNMPDVLLSDVIRDTEDPYAELEDADRLRSLMDVIREAIDEAITNEAGNKQLHYMLEHYFDCSPVDALRSFEPDASPGKAYDLYYRSINKLRRYIRHNKRNEFMHLLYSESYFPDYSTSFKSWERSRTSSVEWSVLDRDDRLKKLKRMEDRQRKQDDER